MKDSNKKIGLMNTLFPLFALAGGVLIFNTPAESGSGQLVFPTLLVLFYALIINGGIKRCPPGQAEYYSDSIYFLGFLYTLIALVVLFLRLNENTKMELSVQIFSMVGISVSTSIAGVLLRNMSRAAYMKYHPENEDSIADATARLAEIARSLQRDSEESARGIRDFLSERESHLQVFNEKEARYLIALDAFSEVTERFCGTLQKQGSALEDAVETFVRTGQAGRMELDKFTGTCSGLYKELGRIRKEADALNLEKLSVSMETLSRDTGDLDKVIDSMIAILDRKIEKVPV